MGVGVSKKLQRCSVLTVFFATCRFFRGTFVCRRGARIKLADLEHFLVTGHTCTLSLSPLRTPLSPSPGLYTSCLPPWTVYAAVCLGPPWFTVDLNSVDIRETPGKFREGEECQPCTNDKNKSNEYQLLTDAINRTKSRNCRVGEWLRFSVGKSNRLIRTC